MMTTNLIPSKNWGAVQKALAVFGTSDVYRQKKTQERGGAADVGNSGGKFGTSRDQLSNIKPK